MYNTMLFICIVAIISLKKYIYKKKYLGYIITTLPRRLAFPKGKHINFPTNVYTSTHDKET